MHVKHICIKICILYKYTSLYEMYIYYTLISLVRVGVDKESGLPNGYGFVDFKDPATCEIAINEFNSMVVMDKKIVCDYAVNAENGKKKRLFNVCSFF